MLNSGGISGEKMPINTLLYKNSNASNSTALSNAINLENQKNSMLIHNNNSINKGSLIGMGVNYATNVSNSVLKQ